MKRITHILCLLLLPFMARAADCVCKPATVAEQLVADGGKCAQAMVDCVIQEKDAKLQRRYVSKLIGYLKQPAPDHPAAATAVWILGEVKATKAIKTLVKQLGLSYIGEIDDLPYRKADPPQALIRIGMPSLLPLLKSAKQYTSPAHRQLIGNMYYLICGSKAAAIAYLEAHTPKAFAEESADIAHWINAVKE